MSVQHHIGTEELEEVSSFLRNELDILPTGHPDRPSTLNNLAMCLSTYYKVSGKIEHLEESISLNRTVLSLYPLNHPDHPTSLVNLASILSTRYDVLGDIMDLEESVLLNRNALDVCPSDHRYHTTCLNNLANCLSTRYEVSGKIEDLQESISLNRDVLSSRPPGHAHRGTSLNNLASVLCTRYEVFGELEDLEQSLSLSRDALSICADDHPDRSTYITNLASTISTRYDVLGNLEDLEESILLNRDALSLRPPGHPDHASSLNNLACALRTCYEALGKQEHIDESVVLNRNALALRPPGHPKRAVSLSGLSRCLSIRYLKASGNVGDLEEAILLSRDALSLRPPGNPHRALSLNSLAFGIFTRYEILGKIEDLEESITLGRNALTLQSPGHPDRSSTLNNLAHCLSTRYTVLGNSDDLEECTSLHRAALLLHPPGHPDRATSLNNLAYCLAARYRVSNEVGDLEECISFDCDAISLHPSGHPDLPTSLNNLAEHLFTRYGALGNTDDLHGSILSLRNAIKLLPAHHSSWFSALNNLARSLSTRFLASSKMEDLEESIALNRKALKLRPPGFLDRSVSLSSLAGVLCGHYRQSGKFQNFEEALALYKQAASDRTSLVQYRLQAAINWTVAARHFHHESTLSAYTIALDLLNNSLVFRSSLESQHTFLATAETARSLASDAASAAIDAGNIELAVEFLEQGRAILWSKLDGFKYPFQQLRETEGGGELADRLETLGSELEHFSLLANNKASFDTNIPLQRALSDAQITRHRVLSQEWEGLLEKIRRRKGFSHFLKAPPFDSLRLAAAEGPVILVNISESRSDAIILLKDSSPEVVKLPDVQLDELRLQKLGTSREISSTQRYLWDNIVSPIVDILQTTLKIQEKSRIWWCPTAELCSLPLHAAGRGKRNLQDIYVSSYTSTLSSLIRARSNLAQSSTTPKVLVIGEPSKDVELKRVKDEVDIIEAFMPDDSVNVLFGEKAHSQLVINELQKHSWVHFACHGHLGDNDQPFRASFELHDRRLPLLDLMRERLPNAELAFLSACHSAQVDSRTPDENIHLSSAMQFCGFRSVVGTLWEMDDADGPIISKEFYEYMFCNPDKIDFRDSAHALNHAIRKMRMAKVPPDRWVLFVHIGA